jgi:hypothetical protein
LLLPIVLLITATLLLAVVIIARGLVVRHVASTGYNLRWSKRRCSETRGRCDYFCVA